MQNSDIRNRITSLHRSQTSPMVFAFKTAPLAPELKASMGLSRHLWFCTLTTATLWPELIVSMDPIPYMSFFAFKTAPLAPDLQVSMGPSPHLWFCAFPTATLWPKLIVSMGPRPHLSFSACKTSWLASELLVSTGPSPHLWFLHVKQRD